jgi:hypothetical protein
VTSPAVLPVVPGLVISGGAQAAAAIYAPDSIVSFVGVNNFYGSVVAAILPNIGITGVHYDEALANPGVRLVGWSEDRNYLPD